MRANLDPGACQPFGSADTPRSVVRGAALAIDFAKGA